MVRTHSYIGIYPTQQVRPISGSAPRSNYPWLDPGLCTQRLFQLFTQLDRKRQRRAAGVELFRNSAT